MRSCRQCNLGSGFGGVRFGGGKVSLSPWLPAGWTGLKFTLRVRESLLRVAVDARGVTLLCEGKPIGIKVYGEEITVSAQELRMERKNP